MRVGLAMAGWRPVAELQFDGFSYPRSTRSSATLRSIGNAHAGGSGSGDDPHPGSPGGIRGKEHHGESPESYYVHTAGLKVVVPSSPLDAYTLLRAAIGDPDPAIVLEPKSRYWSKETGELRATGLDRPRPDRS